VGGDGNSRFGADLIATQSRVAVTCDGSRPLEAAIGVDWWL